MKKTIITTILLSTITTTFALDTLEVTNITNSNNQTTVTFVRKSDEQVFGWFTKTYNKILSLQEVINKASYSTDENIFVTSKLQKVQDVEGQVGKLAQLRMEAWFKNGLTGYFAELARQLSLEN